MECNRFIRLVKSWYLQVHDEALAPARMVAFMEKHIAECEVCLGDPDVRDDVDKIIKIVLPPTKNVKLTGPDSESGHEPSDAELDEVEDEEEVVEDGEKEEDEEDLEPLDVDEEYIDEDDAI